MIARLLMMGVLAGGVIANAYAVDSSYYNAADIPRMQPYCKAKLLPDTTPEETRYWGSRIGDNYGDLHHYCAALNFMNRYWSARTKEDRGYFLSIALDNFNYMVKAEKPNFALRSELYSNRGEVYKLQGKPGEAERDFLHSIELDPTISRPYIRLISFYQGMKRRGEALEMATKGLQHNPDSKALQRYYLELGGKKPFPEPVVAKAAEPAPAPAIEADSPAAATPEPASIEATQQDTPAAATEPDTIGTPTNPYCRFCP